VTHYDRGAALERDVVNLYRDKDWYATRTAGSHTTVDVLAMKQGEIHLIQCSCKKQGKTKAQLEILKALADENKCLAFHAYRDKGVQVVEVTA
jgi:Holliday junction resolvase